MQKISIIVAMSNNNVIGINNTLPWHIPQDLKRFKSLTMGNPIIMGRKTFESMPKALPNRTNIILTKKKDYQPEGALVVNTVEEALTLVEEDAQPFIIGGGEIYRLFMEKCDRIELTRVHHDFDADVFFPSIDTSKWAIVNQEDILATGDQPYNYSYLTYEKK